LRSWITTPSLSLLTATLLAANKPIIHEYSVPTANSNPTSISAGPDGALWFTEFLGEKIGRIAVTGTIEEFPGAGFVSGGANGMTTGSDGNLWFTDNSAVISRICASTNRPAGCPSIGTIAGYSVPTANSYPTGITAGPDGALWFTESSVNNIGRINTSGSVPTCPSPIPNPPSCSVSTPCFCEYPVPTANSYPTSISAGPDGALWFTEFLGEKIGRICPTTSVPSCPDVGVMTEYSVPGHTGIEGITTGPDGVLWFTGAGYIGRINTSGSVPTCPSPIPNPPSCSVSTPCFCEYPVPSGGQNIYSITAGPDGALWFTDYDSNQIGRITTSGVTTEYAVPTASSHPYGITAGPDGALWFVESSGNKIGQIIPLARRNGIDFSAAADVPPAPVLAQFAQAGVQYVVAKAPQTGGPLTGEQLDAFSAAGFKTAAYCYLNFIQSVQPPLSGAQQAQKCINTIGKGRLATISFIALDIEIAIPPPPTCPGSAGEECLVPPDTANSIISEALSTIALATPGKQPVIYTAKEFWIPITGNTTQFNSQPLWTAATARFEGYVDSAGNLACGIGPASLTPQQHCGNGLPSLTPFTGGIFGGWIAQRGNQYDIGINAPKNRCVGACLFGVQVDFDVFDSTLFH
jgi:virginiamycin B lyase